MKAAAFAYQRAASAAEAVALLAAAAGAAKACSGTQSLGPMLNLRLAQPERLVDVGAIEALNGHGLTAEALVVGAAVSHARIEDGALPDVCAGLLPAVAAGIAYRAVRNRGTIGGSLAHADPKADWVNTAHLVDAAVDVLGPAGERRVACADFFVGPFTTVLADDELIVAVRLPRFAAGARWSYRKSCRKPGEFAEALVALLDDPGRGVARAVLGALDRMPVVVDGVAAVAALRAPGAVAACLAAAGVDDVDLHELHATLLARAFADFDRVPAP